MNFIFLLNITHLKDCVLVSTIQYDAAFKFSLLPSFQSDQHSIEAWQVI